MSDIAVIAVDATTVRIDRTVRRFRFLFDDGSTVDVIADRDDSDMREAVRKWSGTERIVGVAALSQESETP